MNKKKRGVNNAVLSEEGRGDQILKKGPCNFKSVRLWALNKHNNLLPGLKCLKRPKSDLFNRASLFLPLSSPLRKFSWRAWMWEEWANITIQQENSQWASGCVEVFLTHKENLCLNVLETILLLWMCLIWTTSCCVLYMWAANACRPNFLELMSVQAQQC